MARPRSEEKRLALLQAATETVSEHGLGAPTSLIAKKAGVAEGTLFRYFPTKDELLNALYVHLKRGMCEAMSRHYAPSAQFQARVESLWNSYIDWGLTHPVANKALNQLSVSSVITPATKDKSNALFPEVGIPAGFAGSHVFAGQTAFADAVFLALADTTMAFAARTPRKAKAYKAIGFAALWRMYGHT